MLAREQIEPKLARLAKSVAVALGDAEIRETVHDEFTHSPFAEGKLHFRTFIETTGTFAHAIETAAGVPLQAIFAQLDSIVDLEFYMPVEVHRQAWSGGDNLLVAAMLDDDGSQPIGYSLSGDPVELSADEPPSTPTVVLVPVETDFSTQASLAALSSTSGTFEGSYLKYMRVSDPESYEGWGMGNPEFEVHAHVQQSTGTYTDLSCSGEQQSSPHYFHYDGDPDWNGTVLLASRSMMESGDVQLQVWEDDTDPCTATGGRPVRTNELSQEDLAAIAAMGGAAVLVYEAFQDTVWYKKVLSVTALVGATWKTTEGVHKDDHVGVIQWPPNGCWSEDSGALWASIVYPVDGSKVGSTRVDNNLGEREPLCALSVTLNGPRQVETCAFWPSPQPEPYYNASVSGGSGTISYEWYEDGVLEGTSANYDLQDVSLGQHSLEVRVVRGEDAGGDATVVTVSEAETCGFGI